MTKQKYTEYFILAGTGEFGDTPKTFRFPAISREAAIADVMQAYDGIRIFVCREAW